MRTTSEQKEKIRTLKISIKEEVQRGTDLLVNLDLEKESELPQEEQDKNKQIFRDALALNKANLKALREELKLTRLNTHGSSFFSYTPHTGFNRRQARQFRNQTAKLRRDGKL